MDNIIGGSSGWTYIYLDDQDMESPVSPSAIEAINNNLNIIEELEKDNKESKLIIDNLRRKNNGYKHEDGEWKIAILYNVVEIKE